MRNPNEERGATLVVFALCLVVLMIFAAFAVDLGLVYNERRLDQNGVDAAATSAGVVTLTGGTAQQVVNEVLAKVTSDLHRSVPSSAWLSPACTDGEQLAKTAAELGLTPATQCISFSNELDRLRVKLPSQTVPQVFSKAFGVGPFSSGAFAEITFLSQGSGGALPFVALSNSATGQQICLKTSSSGNPPALAQGNGPGNPATYPAVATLAVADPCDQSVFDPASSNFGSLLPYRYATCTNNTNADFIRAISEGLDHPTGYFGDATDGNPPPFSIPIGGTSSSAHALRQATYGDVRIDGNQITNCDGFFPNTVEINTGFSAQDVRCGFLSPKNSDTCDGIVPRLRRGTPAPSSSPVFLEELANNVTPWAYFSNADNLPQECKDLRTAHQLNSSSWDFYDRREAFVECLTSWNPSAHGELFTEAIATNPRYGFVPKIAERRLCNQQEPPGCNQLDYAHINSYVPVYLNRLYSSGAGVCDPLDARGHNWALLDAGQDFGGNCGAANNNLDRVSAYVIDCRMLPETVCDDTLLPGLPDDPEATRTIYEFSLSR